MEKCKAFAWNSATNRCWITPGDILLEKWTNPKRAKNAVCFGRLRGNSIYMSTN